MLRSMVGKVVRRTPVLRRFVRSREEAPASPPSAGFGEPTPRPTPPVEAGPAPVARPAPAPAAEPAPAPAEKPAPAPAAEPAPVQAAPSEQAAAEQPAAEQPAAKKAAAKKTSTKKAASKKAASKKAAEPVEEAEAERKTEGGRDEAEVERLRVEAEKRKAEIRARKEAEEAAKAPAPAPAAAGGIAALIAQTGGKVEAASAGVRATSGLAWVPEDTDVHLSDDGAEYWGAIDNDSSRAYARGDTLVIDQWECINCGTCVENTEHVFALPVDAKAVVVSQEGPMDLIQDAIDACPVTCIHWTDNPDQFEQINDAEGNPLG